MDDNIFRKQFGSNFDALTTAEKIMQGLEGRKYAENASEKVFRALSGIMPAQNMVESITSKMKSYSGWDYITEPKNNALMMYDAMTLIAEKQNSYQTIFGGTTVSNIAKFLQNSQQEPYNPILQSIKEIKDIVNQNSRAYEAQMTVSKLLVGALSANKLFENATKYQDLFSSSNYIKNKALNPFDVLAGASFANITSIYETSEKTETLENELNFLHHELSSNKDLVKDTNKFVEDISAVKEDYIKTEEVLTRWVHSYMVKFGWSLQRSHYFVFILIILFGIFVKDIHDSFKDKPAINNYITIINKSESKLKNTDQTIKNSPVYEKALSSTRKLGIIKENVNVEIIRNKSGWSYVKAFVTITKKINGQKIYKDSLMQVWVQQNYLKGFQ